MSCSRCRPHRRTATACSERPAASGALRDNAPMSTRPSAPRHFSMIRGFHLADCLHARQRRLRRVVGAVRDDVHGQPLGRAPAAVGGDDAAGLRLRRLRRAHRALAAPAFGDGPRARFAGRCHLLRRRPGRARLCRRPARRLGHGDPVLLRLLRRQPAGALQRHAPRSCRPAPTRCRTSKARRFPPAWSSPPCWRWPPGRARSATQLWGGAWQLGPWLLHPLSAAVRCCRAA